MATFLLIRHAAPDLPGPVMSGRTPGVHLCPRGREQAKALAERLAEAPIRAIYSSPLERTRETAECLARRLELLVQVRPELGELDFGEWTGKMLNELEPLPEWALFNQFRSVRRIPGGETLQEAQARMVRFMIRLHEEQPDGLIALVSHSDVIKAALVYFLGMPLDLMHRIEIDQASVSAVAFEEWTTRVLYVNHSGDPRHVGPPR